MKTILASVLIIAFLSLSFARSDELDSCASVDECLKRIYEISESGRSNQSTISENGWAVANRIALFGNEAVKRLVPMLMDPNDQVAQIAALALRETKSIDPKYLPEIIAALDGKRRLGWLPPALGRINSPLAAEEAVKRFIVSDSAPHNQEAYAVKLSGKRAIPFIIKAAKSGMDFGSNHYGILGYVLGKMDDDTRAEAAKSLMASLSSASTPDETRTGMIYMISFLKQSALIIESDLISFKEKHPELEDVVNKALIGMKSKQSGAILAHQLSIKPDYLVLRDLAETGPAGVAAGPIVTRLLNHSDQKIRLAAARTLGYIRYKEAIPALIPLLDDPSDVKLNWIAAESLGRIADKSAIKALTKTSNAHWYIAVREAASKAIGNIKSNTGYQSQYHEDNFAFDFFSYSHFEIKACQRIRLKKIKDPTGEKLRGDQDKEKLNKLSYPSEVVTIGVADEAEQLAKDPNAIIEIRPDNMIRHRHAIDQIPDVALKTEHGWLVGSSRGEWGGELVSLPDGGKPALILNENIKDICKLGGRYIALAGLAHLMSNHGMIYELKPTENNGWDCLPWRSLPGAPKTSWFVETGELLVNTSGGGSILISQDGSMRMAPCK